MLTHRLAAALLVPALLAASGVVARSGRLVVVVRGDEVVLAGRVESRDSFVAAVRGRAPRLTDALAPGGSSPLSPDAVASLVAGVLAAGVRDFSAVVEWRGLTVRAVVANEAQSSALHSVVRSPGLAVWSDVDVAPGFCFEPATTAWEGDGPALANRVGRLLLAVPGARVTLIGHASSEHPDPRGLARTRAALVRELLVAQGVRPERVAIAVRLDVAPESADPATRRVEVLVS